MKPKTKQECDFRPKPLNPSPLEHPTESMKTRPETIVIVGGVAGGASAAARARRHSESAHIILIERGPDVSFANCGLPYHIGGEIPDRAELALQTPESLRTLLNLEVRTLTEATAIDRANKQVRVRSLTDGDESVISYEKLVLSPGASPLRPPLPGIESPLILTLRNLEDMDRIKAAAAKVDRVAIIGAGFIGLEMAEQLHAIGKQVSVIELQPQVLPQLDAEMARPLAKALREKGVELILGDGIEGFESLPDGISARLKSGKSLETGLVILSIGVLLFVFGRHPQQDEQPRSHRADESVLDFDPRFGDALQ